MAYSSFRSNTFGNVILKQRNHDYTAKVSVYKDFNLRLMLFNHLYFVIANTKLTIKVGNYYVLSKNDRT